MMVTEKKSKKIFFSLGILVFNILFLRANEPDSAYIFAYGEENGSGLYFAWSIDKDNWHAIGEQHTFLRSDYGRWGSQKKMYDPFLFQAPDGQWHCVWSLNNQDGAIAHTVSSDLLYWMPQSYPVLMANGNCLRPEISHDARSGEYRVVWQSDAATRGTFQSVTGNFQTYTLAERSNTNEAGRGTVVIDGETRVGTAHRVAWDVVDRLMNAQRLAAYKHSLNGERVAMNPEQFKEPITISIMPDLQQAKTISDMLIGIFYEDINYAADGGLYAELVQNRGFEYAMSDKEGRDENWNSRTGWSVVNGNEFQIDTVSPI